MGKPKKHKRKKCKTGRAACCCCKAHKLNGYKGTFGAQTMQEKKARIGDKEENV